MTSKNNKSYVVYHTTYSGNLMPQNYIGSSSIDSINNGYIGSVSSKEYKCIWDSERKLHPELFYVEIISYHDTRKEALYKELQIQKIFNVVKNPLFINKSYASVNGFFGMDVKGENNPNYNKKWDNDQKQKASLLSKDLHAKGILKPRPPKFGEDNNRYKDGKTTFKDKDGNFVFTKTDDIRVLNGELVGVGTNVQKCNSSKAMNPNMKKYEYVIIQTPTNEIIKLLWNEYNTYFKENKLNNIISLKNVKGYNVIELKENPNCKIKPPIKRSFKIL